MKHRSNIRTLRRRKTMVAASAAVLLASGALTAASISGTGATFTDVVTGSGNAFTAGSVDIAATQDGSTAFVPLTASAMTPGDYAYTPLTIKNTGSLDLRYAITSTLTSKSTASGGLQDGTQFAMDLMPTIKTGLTPAACNAETGAGDAAWTAGASLVSAAGALADASAILGNAVNLVGDPATGSQGGDRSLAPGASETLCLQMGLPTTAANADQGASLTFTLGISAEQTTNN